MGRKIGVIRLPLGLARHKARYDLVLRKIIGTAPDIVPHYETAERELSEECEFLYIPAFLRHYRLSHGAEHQRYINAVIVRGKRIKPVHRYAVILAEQFQQRYIHLRFFAAYAQRIRLILYLFD